MEKEFVPFRESLALKELGFNESCLASYGAGYKSQLRLYGCGALLFDVDGLITNDTKEIICAAPLYQQVFRWFRDKYSIHCEITQDRDWEEDNESWSFVIYKYRNGDNDGMKSSDKSFDTYEEAELACLKKLIEIAKVVK